MASLLYTGRLLSDSEYRLVMLLIAQMVCSLSSKERAEGLSRLHELQSLRVRLQKLLAESQLYDSERAAALLSGTDLVEEQILVAIRVSTYQF